MINHLLLCGCVLAVFGSRCVDNSQIITLAHQSTLLEKMFSRVHLNAFQEFSHGLSVANICNWEAQAYRCEIGCSNGGYLERFEVQGFEDAIGQFDISFFPNTVQFLDIVRCRQKSKILTRYFPREAINISLSVNEFYGAPDLTTLPDNLESLYLTRNHLTGPISLCNLPKSLKGLFLGDNRIEQEFLPYANFPPKIKKVCVEGNMISAICSINESERIEKKDIFKGVRRKNIQ